VSQAYDTSAWDPDAMPAPARDDELVLLANESMRARRRPLAVLALWAWQLAFALLIAWPVSSTVASWYGAHPSGDQPLWTPGAHALVDLLDAARQGSIGGLATLTMLVFLIAGFADLVPLATLIASMAYVTRERTAPRLRPVIARGAAVFPTFASLFAIASLVEGLLVGIAVAASAILSHRASSHLGEARANQLGWLVGLVILGLACVVGVLHDLARAASVRFRVRTIRACRCAMNAFLRNPVYVMWSWAWRASAGWAPVAIGGLVAAKVGGHGGVALFALAVVHQLVALSRVAFRASWLATALRAVDHAHRVIRSR
jgi:hypothetical protein